MSERFRPYEPEPSDPIALARAMASHLRYGRWAHDDKELCQAADKYGKSLDDTGWSQPFTSDQAQFVEALLAKAAESDWSWESNALTGVNPIQFATARKVFAQQGFRGGAESGGQLEREHNMSGIVDLDSAFARVGEHWRPKVVADVNDHEVKVVKVQGEFPWHSHANVDELFLVWRGEFRLEFRDRVLRLGRGQAAVAPRGVEHRTCADHVAEVVIVEQRGVLNTGDATPSEFTAPVGARL